MQLILLKLFRSYVFWLSFVTFHCIAMIMRDRNTARSAVCECERLWRQWENKDDLLSQNNKEQERRPLITAALCAWCILRRPLLFGAEAVVIIFIRPSVFSCCLKSLCDVEMPWLIFPVVDSFPFYCHLGSRLTQQKPCMVLRSEDLICTVSIQMH